MEFILDAIDKASRQGQGQSSIPPCSLPVSRYLTPVVTKVYIVTFRIIGAAAQQFPSRNAARISRAAQT